MTGRSVTFDMPTKIGGRLYPAGTHRLPAELADALAQPFDAPPSGDFDKTVAEAVAARTSELEAQLVALKTRLNIVTGDRDALKEELQALKAAAEAAAGNTRPASAKSGKTA